MIADVPYNEAADNAVRFISRLTLSGDFKGKPFVLRPWQESITRRLFGTIDEDGKPQYSECGIWLPRKNAKTELAAAFATYKFMTSKEEGEIYTAAAEREQAGIMFHKVAGMIRANAALESRCKIINSQKRIIHRRTGTVFVSVSAEAGSKHGYNPTMVIGDEIHCWKNDELWTALTTGSDTRENPLFVTITTAGLYDPTSFEWRIYEEACKIRDNPKRAPHYLPIIYAADREADWLDEEVWHKVNPALGDFRKLEAMRREADKAKRIPSFENDFRRLYLNQHTAQKERWLSMEDWLKCGADEFPDLSQGSAVAGLDLSTKQDITALVVLTQIGKHIYVTPYFWIPEDMALAKEEKDRTPYLSWKQQGIVRFTPGSRVDYEVIVKEIESEIAPRHNFRVVAIDPWNAGGINQTLQNLGFDIVLMNQNAYRNMNEGCRELEALLADGLLVHPKNDCLTWMAGNADCERNASGHIRPIKSSEINRIDGITSLVMGLSYMLAASDDTEDDWYIPGMLTEHLKNQ